MRLSRLRSMFTMLFLVTALIGLTMAVHAVTGNPTCASSGIVSNVITYTLTDDNQIKTVKVYDSSTPPKLIASKGLGGPGTTSTTIKVDTRLGTLPFKIVMDDYGTPTHRNEWDDSDGSAFAARAPDSDSVVQSVGGYVIPVDNLGLLAPYIGLASTMTIGAVTTIVFVKRVKRRKEKQ